MILKGKTVLITGGTSGIGLELAIALSGRRNSVIITGRDQAKIEAVRRRYPELHAVRCDVTRAEDISALHEAVIAHFPACDVLVNNAGIMRNLKLASPQGVEEVTREIDILLSGPIRMVQQFLPLLLRQRSAAVINVSSGLAFIPMPISPIYCAAKAGLHSFSQSLRAQLEGTSVQVIELAPPPVETKLFRQEFSEEMKGEKAMPPKKLVARAIAGIESGKTEIAPGLAGVLRVASRVAPNIMFRQMAKLGRPMPA